MVRIPKLKQWDIVRIEWSDPHALSGEWHEPADKDMSVDGCETVGFVYKVHEDRITIASTRDVVLNQINGGMTIPFVNICSIRALAR